MANNVRFKDMLFEERQVFGGVDYVPLEFADRVLDQIYSEIDSLEIKELERLIHKLKQKLD